MDEPQPIDPRAMPLAAELGSRGSRRAGRGRPPRHAGARALHRGRRAARRVPDVARGPAAATLAVPAACRPGSTTATIEAQDELPRGRALDGFGDGARRARSRGPEDDRRPGATSPTTRGARLVDPRRSRRRRVIDGRPAARLAAVAHLDATTTTTTTSTSTTTSTRRATSTTRRRRREAERLVRKEIALSQIRQYGDPALRMRADEVEDVRRRPAPARRADDRAHARRPGRRARRDAGRRPPPLSSSSSPTTRTARRRQPGRSTPIGDETGDRRRRAASRCRACASRSSAPSSVTLEGQDADGDAGRARARGPSRARVVQHELDHLDGVLIIDRTDAEHGARRSATLRPPARPAARHGAGSRVAATAPFGADVLERLAAEHEIAVAAHAARRAARPRPQASRRRRRRRSPSGSGSRCSSPSGRSAGSTSARRRSSSARTGC